MKAVVRAMVVASREHGFSTQRRSPCDRLIEPEGRSLRVFARGDEIAVRSPDNGRVNPPAARTRASEMFRSSVRKKKSHCGWTCGRRARSETLPAGCVIPSHENVTWQPLSGPKSTTSRGVQPNSSA